MKLPQEPSNIPDTGVASRGLQSKRSVQARRKAGRSLPHRRNRMIQPASIPQSSDPQSTNARWTQLIIGIVCMVMIANLQYGWTLFVNPIDQKYHWGRAAIQVAFSIFVATETWLVPVEGWIVDKFGPRIVVAVGGVLVAIAWFIDSNATTLGML